MLVDCAKLVDRIVAIVVSRTVSAVVERSCTIPSVTPCVEAARVVDVVVVLVEDSGDARVSLEETVSDVFSIDVGGMVVQGHQGTSRKHFPLRVCLS